MNVEHTTTGNRIAYDNPHHDALTEAEREVSLSVAQGAEVPPEVVW